MLVCWGGWAKAAVGRWVYRVGVGGRGKWEVVGSGRGITGGQRLYRLPPPVSREFMNNVFPF
jgi:hypothetical protein